MCCLTNSEFASLGQDHSKIWECDNCCSKSISTLPSSALDDDNCLTIDGILTKQTSDDVNIISADDRKFASLCEHI